MSSASSLKRAENIQQLQQKEFDLLVIGGGITGSGIALDAATRGLKVALVEMQDFASGTSSRSTKLVHGGLRYLKQFEIKEVGDLGKERAIVYENGPHVTTPVWMLLPFYKGGTFGKFTTSIGLRLYDFLASVKKSERRSMLNVDETLQKEPLVKKDGLRGGGIYVEYRTDDARLTIEVAKMAIEKGAVLLNYVKATQFIYDDKHQIIGVGARDEITGEKITIKAKKVVNAAGPWVDEVRRFEGKQSGKHLILSKGVHIVFDSTKFPLRQAVYFDTPDGRMVFAIPRNGKTYVGTTDTFYTGDPKIMTVAQSDRDYIMKAIHYMFPNVKVTDEDIESSWAGVRPLIHEEGKNPSEISRKDEVWKSDSGLVTIAGGKLTGYRKMAETVVDQIALELLNQFHIKSSPCITKKLPISGGDMGGSKNLEKLIEKKSSEAQKLGLSAEEAKNLVRHYGTNIDKVLEYVKEGHQSLPDALYAQLRYGIEHELVVHPVDFLVRRTGNMFFNIDRVIEYKDIIIEEMGKIFNWDEEICKKYKQELLDEITKSTTAY